MKIKSIFLIILSVFFVLYNSVAVAADRKPPSVSITSPPSGTPYTSAQTVTITATASDRVGVTKVEFYDGSTLKGTDTSSPYTYAWTFTSADNSTHNWTAKAYDAVNNSSVSSIVSLIINIPTPVDTTPPSAPTGLTATPGSWTNTNSFSINWTNPSDPSGIAGAYYKLGSAPTSNTDGTYTTSKPFNVSATSQGGQTIYVWLKDGAGNINYLNRSSTTLYYDSTAPTDGTLNATPGNTQVSLNWSGFSDSGGSGLKSTNTYKVMRSTGTYPGSQCTSGTQVYLGSGSSATDTGLTNGTTYFYRACAYDNAGNTSTGATANATPVVTAPTGSITINNYAAYTNSASVTLTLSCTKTGGTCTQMQFSNDNVSWAAAETYATAKVWALTTGDGTKTVFVKFKDNSNNWSTAYSDTIFLDTVPPQCSVIINYDATYTNSTSVTLTLSAIDPNPASGVAQMCVSDSNSSCSSWVAYATSMPWTLLPTGDGTKTVYAWFKDNAGNVTPTPSTTSDTIILDTTKPQPVTGLTVTAISSSQIDLSWSPSYDTGPSGLAGYKVYRVPATNPIGTTTATNYSDNNGLAANTQYCYQVAAYDNAGNNSAKCTQICATTQSVSLPGELLWAEAFGNTGADIGKSIAVDGNGNILIAGYFQGTVNFGGSSLTSAGSYDIFVAKYSANGAHLWSQRFGSTEDDFAQAIAVDSSGNVVITGYFQGTVNFGGSSLTSAGSYDIFVAKYSANGSHLWSKRFGSTNNDVGYGVAMDNSGNVVVTGFFMGTVDFGGGPLSSTYGGLDTFVAKYSASGTHLWSKKFLNTSDDLGYSISVDSNGNVAVTGSFMGKVDFGGGTWLISAGDHDIFLAMFQGTDGAHLWSKRFGSTGFDRGYGVAIDSNGNVAVTGIFIQTVDFGGGPLTSSVFDIFVAKYTSSGQHMWSKRFGSNENDYGYGIAVDSSDNIILTGFFRRSVDFGGSPLNSAGLQDIFLAKYSANGTHLWSKRFGGPKDDVGYGVAVNSNDSVVVTGYFQDTADFDSELLTSAGSADISLIKLEP